MHTAWVLFASTGLFIAHPVAAQVAAPGTPIPGIPTGDSLRGALDPGREAICPAPETLLDLRGDFGAQAGGAPTAIAVLEPTTEQRAALRDARFALRADEYQSCGITIAIFDIPPELALEAARKRLDTIAPTLRWRFARP